MRLSASKIAQAVNGQLIGLDIEVDGVSIDTRTLKPGNLYLAITGQQFDGHDFVAQAEQAGAVVLLVSKPANSTLPQILVEDSHLALAELAGYWRNTLSVKIAGVTGSNGKTTVKEMIAAIFATQGQTFHTKGNLNNDIGVPLTLLQLTDEHRYAVIEMGANHIGEIAYTSRYAQADVSVITNVGAAHLEGFGSIEGVAKTKGEIIESLSASGVAVLNRDDAFYDFWRQMAGSRKTVSFGFNSAADVKATEIRSVLENGRFLTRFQCHAEGNIQAFELALAGEHNVKNTLAATAVALQFGISLAEIGQGLQTLKPVTGRMQPLQGRQGNIIIDDTYNANPSSLQAALDSLDSCNDAAWLVLGAFGELGPESPALHRQMGEMIKRKGIKRLFATGADARQTATAFGEGGEYFDSQEQLILALKQALTGHETILVKGSRAQKMENVVAALVDNFRAA
jgi:UDP-N-acetylmuramoyl-tripeptide--D-alanyl-D-alanine ligase